MKATVAYRGVGVPPPGRGSMSVPPSWKEGVDVAPARMIAREFRDDRQRLLAET